MKKIYLTLGLGVLFLGANAQQTQKKQSIKKSFGSSYSSKLSNNNSTFSTTCDTVTTVVAADSLLLYTCSTSTAIAKNGYVAGNNGYGDDIKATFIPAVDIPAGGGQITGVIALFVQQAVGTTLIGTHGTETISVNILNGDTSAGPTGTAIATGTASLAVISTMTTATNEVPYLFNFTTPVATPTVGFFAALNLPSTTGDTAVLYIAKNYSLGHSNYAWDHNPGNSGTGWLAFSNASDWGLDVSLTLLPIICTTPAGIKTNVLETSIAYFPNPTNGEFNFAVALQEATNLTISITNMLGQTVFSKVESNITNSVIRYDLSSIGKGVYFANITDSKNNTVTKKVIVQ